MYICIKVEISDSNFRVHHWFHNKSSLAVHSSEPRSATLAETQEYTHYSQHLAAQLATLKRSKNQDFVWT